MIHLLAQTEPPDVLLNSPFHAFTFIWAWGFMACFVFHFVSYFTGAIVSKTNKHVA